MNERAIFNSAVSAIALNALYKMSQDSGRAAPHERLVGLEHHQPERQLVCGAPADSLSGPLAAAQSVHPATLPWSAAGVTAVTTAAATARLSASLYPAITRA